MVGFSYSYRVGKSSAWSILEHFVNSKGNPIPTSSDPSPHLAHLFELISKTKQEKDVTNVRLSGHVSVLIACDANCRHPPLQSEYLNKASANLFAGRGSCL